MKLFLEKLNDEVINRVNASHDAAIANMVVEADQLREVLATMSVTEACDEAMRAIVQ